MLIYYKPAVDIALCYSLIANMIKRFKVEFGHEPTFLALGNNWHIHPHGRIVPNYFPALIYTTDNQTPLDAISLKDEEENTLEYICKEY